MVTFSINIFYKFLALKSVVTLEIPETIQGLVTPRNNWHQLFLLSADISVLPAEEAAFALVILAS